jgi:hypothetical protein
LLKAIRLLGRWGKIVAKFLHVTVSGGPSKTRELGAVFDVADDWLRYAPNCWILRSDESIDVWLSRLKRATGRSSNIFVIEFNPREATGYLPETQWEWFKKNNVKFSS